MTIRTVFCIDGSATNAKKRPLYRLDVTKAGPCISRCAGDRIVETLAGAASSPDAPVLLLADVPLGLPDQFPAVYTGNPSFLDWLDATHQRTKGVWRQMVASGVAGQSPMTPFVENPTRGTKANGKFPKRRCDAKTSAESLYWCMGPRQVGKAALQFWFETLIPLRKKLEKDLAVWPFESTEGKKLIVAECYPAILYSLAWGHKVVKTDPEQRVDCIAKLRASQPTIADELTFLHAVSTDDDFDMFTTALAWTKQEGDALAFPASAKPFEGWMAGLTP